MAKFKVEAKKIRQVLRELDYMSDEAWDLHKDSIGFGGYNEGISDGIARAHDLLLEVLPSKYRP